MAAWSAHDDLRIPCLTADRVHAVLLLKEGDSPREGIRADRPAYEFLFRGLAVAEFSRC